MGRTCARPLTSTAGASLVDATLSRSPDEKFQSDTCNHEAITGNHEGIKR